MHLQSYPGPQLDVPILEPAANIQRFKDIFTSFIFSLACKEHPLVIFLDDLQCMDFSSPSLDS
jgi:histidine kinase